MPASTVVPATFRHPGVEPGAAAVVGGQERSPRMRRLSIALALAAFVLAVPGDALAA